MEHDAIRRLARLMEELGLAELEVEDEASRVRLVRAVARPAERTAPAGGESRPEIAAPSSSPAEDAIPPGLAAIRSPMVGTFWRAPSADAPPFVSPGEVVEPGAVLCLVEAMKTMNEILAESAGRIVSVRPENGTPVEYGTILFLVEPVG